MNRLLLLCAILFLAACKTTTVYVSRHMEKAGAMSADPPLTTQGEQQAIVLRDYLQGKKIGAVYSTNFLRTKATAQPTAASYNLPVNLYNPAQSTALADSLKTSNNKNVLIVGHSNTVDDIVNRFTGTNSVRDLPETEYGSLFILKKKGANFSVQKIILPGASNQ